MLKKMLGKKQSESASDSSSEEEKDQKKEKRSSLANIKAKFENSSKEKTTVREEYKTFYLEWCASETNLDCHYKHTLSFSHLPAFDPL